MRRPTPALVSTAVLVGLSVVWGACGSDEALVASPNDDAALPAERDAFPPPPPPPSAIPDGASPDAADAAREAAAPIGCGTPAPKTGLLGAQPVVVGGKSRSYAVNLPSTYDGTKTFPVIFVFHGVAQDPFVVRDAFQFERDHEAAAIFVYPNATALWDILHYDDAANPDVAFFDALFADLERRYCLDESRVFATGVSRGGYFANHLACHRSGVVKAVASHAAGGPLDPSGTHFSGAGNVVCPGKRIPALVVVGDADTVALSDAEVTRRFYRASNGCTTATTPTTPTPCLSLAGCSERVTYCRVPGLAHELWSAGAKATWDFFGLR